MTLAGPRAQLPQQGGSSIASTSPDRVSTSSARSAWSEATGSEDRQQLLRLGQVGRLCGLLRIAEARAIEHHPVRLPPGKMGNPTGVAVLLKAKSRSPQTPAKLANISGNCSPRMLLTGYRSDALDSTNRAHMGCL